jgi:hypothetical protein
VNPRWLLLAGGVLLLAAPPLYLACFDLSLRGMIPPIHPAIALIVTQGVTTTINWWSPAPRLDAEALVVSMPGLLFFLASFPRFRNARAFRILTLIAFFPLALGLFVALAQPYPEGNDFFDSGVALRIPPLLLAALPALGMLWVGGQLLARVSPETRTATALWILGATSALLHLQIWNRLNLHPWMLAGWAGILGGLLVVIAETIELRRPRAAAPSA